MDPPARPPAKQMGDEFAKKYYTVLQDYPQHLRRLYKDSSKIGRTRNNGMMCLCTLLDKDDDNLNMLSYGGFDSAEVTSIISQDCQGGVVLVVVGGYSTLKETIEMMNFTQVFLLAPQEPEGYFVLIDMLHFDDQTIVSASNVIEEEVAETEVSRKEVAETEVTRKEVAETEVTHKEVGDDSLRVSEPNDGFEDVSKISDASVVVKAIQKGQGQHPSSDLSLEIKADANDETGNGNNHEDQAVTEGAGVCLKNLPPHASIELVQNAFEEFGAIRRDGIVVINKWGFSYGFIEFEEANSARMAIEASPVIVLGRRVRIMKKKRRFYDFWDWQVKGGTEEASGGKDEVSGRNNEAAGRKDEVSGGKDEVSGGKDEVSGGKGKVSGGKRGRRRESKVNLTSYVDRGWNLHAYTGV